MKCALTRSPLAFVVLGALLASDARSLGDRFVPYYARGGPDVLAIYSRGAGDVNADGFADLLFINVPAN